MISRNMQVYSRAEKCEGGKMQESFDERLYVLMDDHYV